MKCKDFQARTKKPRKSETVVLEFHKNFKGDPNLTAVRQNWDTRQKSSSFGLYNLKDRKSK